MTWYPTPYALFMLATTLLSLSLAYYMWSRRPARGATALALRLGAVTLWSFGYTMELGTPTLAAKLFWTNFNFIGIVTGTVFWFIFALQYTYHDRWLSPRNLALLFTPSLLTLLLTWTNAAHGLIRRAATLNTTGPWPVFAPTYGIAFWLFWLYALFLLIASTLLLLHKLLTTRGLYFSQAAALLCGMLLPWTGNIIYLSGHSPIHGLDLTPFSFALSGLVLAWGLFHSRLLDIMPIAHEVIFASMPAGLIVLDPYNRVVDLNPPAQELLSCAMPDCVGQPLAAVLPDWLTRSSLPEAPTVSQTSVVRTTPPPPRYFELTSTPLFDRDAHFMGRVLVLHDITARQTAEAQLTQYATQLERSNADLQQFATVISHDLQTPLRQVTNFLKLLKKRYYAPLNAEARELIDIAVTNAQQMHQLIQDLLEYSRLDARGQDPAPLDPAPVLANILRGLQFQMSDCGAEITHDPLPLVCADATQVSQLFQNLLGNALKFRRADVPPRIHIAVERLGAQWQFAVRDNGLGIAPQYHEHIFTIFQRGAMTHNDEYEGTGVGLAICQKIVERHGGHIWVESTEGQGTTFYFTLPAVSEST